MHSIVLSYLREVVRQGSIRKASNTLNISATAINRQILNLEDEIGVKIFDRLPGGMRLTPVGEVLMRHVRDTLHGFDKFKDEVESLRGSYTGSLRLAALDSFVLDFIPKCLIEYSRTFPAVCLVVSATPPLQIVQRIVNNEADIGISFVTGVERGVQMVGSILMPVGVVISSKHPVSKLSSVDFGDLRDVPVVVPPDHFPATDDSQDGIAAFRKRTQARFISNNIGLSRQLILSGLGFGFYTKIGFLDDIERGELAWLPLVSPSLFRAHVGVFVSLHRSLSPAGNRLVASLLRHLDRLQEHHQPTRST